MCTHTTNSRSFLANVPLLFFIKFTLKACPNIEKFWPILVLGLILATNNPHNILRIELEKD
jgi:hypothetical protein